MMPVLHHRHAAKFTIIPNELLHNTDLSLRDIGLLCYMLSMPDNWTFSHNGLCSAMQHDGREALKKSVKALEAAGYLQIKKAVSAGGKFTGCDWYVSDVPYAEKPSSGKPADGKPEAVNPQLQRNIQTRTDIQRNNVQRENLLPHGQYGNVLLSDSELLKLREEFPDSWEHGIDRLSNYMRSKGKRYSDHYATIRLWLREDSQKAAAANIQRCYEDCEDSL